jgi:uroporphyrinogen-III decarboxylase
MAPEELKQEFGDRVTFWGGGVDTQKTLPFGTAEEVRHEVSSRLKIFGKDGGYVFNSIHNIQARVPIENVLAMYETVRDCGRY